MQATSHRHRLLQPVKRRRRVLLPRPAPFWPRPPPRPRPVASASDTEAFLVEGRRQVFLQRRRADLDGHQFAGVDAAQIRQVLGAVTKKINKLIN